jgi:chemotaxis protein MotB
MGRKRRISSPITAWPGYVDVLSALLMVVIFVLMIFTIAQFLLSNMLHSQKNELMELHGQISELTKLLGLETKKSLQLKKDVSRLSDTIVGLSGEKEMLTAELSDYTAQSEIDKAELEKQMLTIASLNEDINTLRQVKNELEKNVTDLAGALYKSEHEILVLRDRSKALTARLAKKAEMTALAQKEIKEQTIRIQALISVVDTQKEAIASEKQLSANTRAEVSLLTKQINGLRDQLKMISDALALTKEKARKKDEKITELGKKLNIALAKKINELEKYQSEFFKRLEKILGNNPAIQAKGDRFVFQAGLLFKSASADLGAEGRTHLAILAHTLQEVSNKIPKDLKWILRIDGHTDRIPIHNEIFASNWELSTARAVSVVRFLSQNGIPKNRMAAAGFSKYHPIDSADTPEAYKKNRRIEIKLTSQ